MEIPELHSWDFDYRNARILQTKLRTRLNLNPLSSNIRTVAGCDVSNEKGGNRFTAAVVVLSFPDFSIIEESCAHCTVDFPYVPGLLSFREMPPLLAAWRKIECAPDLVYCDGSGMIHPRRFGLACHLGLWLGIPTIGCAKNLLCGDYETPGSRRGEWAKVYLDGEAVGAAVRTRADTKPMFISPGNLLSLEQSVQFTMEACPKYRLPEPIRAAHKAANSARKQSL